jgi:hypothetical protein
MVIDFSFVCYSTWQADARNGVPHNFLIDTLLVYKLPEDCASSIPGTLREVQDSSLNRLDDRTSDFTCRSRICDHEKSPIVVSSPSAEI